MPKWLFRFLLAWLFLNLFQIFTTELFNDEALYWAFAQRPDMGYFDHPPMTAWIIWLTDWIPGELGVRLLFTLMSVATIYGLYYLIRPKDSWLFMAIVSGMSIIHLGGFFAAPDVPLIFFMVIFLMCYKHYFYEDNMKLAIVMGIALAAMGWSKYHAILFAFAFVLSNVEIFKRKSFYLMVGTAILCVLPHLYWQYTHDWITLDFHFNHRRGQKPWHWVYVTEFLGSQLLIYGPFISLLLFPSAVKFKQRDHYDCVMKYVFMVVMVFFALNTFRGRVEANWTAMIMPPLVYLGYLYIENKPGWRKWALFSGFAGFVLLILFRLLLAFQILPSDWKVRNETHGFSKWSKKIGELAGGRPVVFINNYRKPAKYSFYHGGQTYDWNMAKYSGNQYDLWIEDELALQGKEVLIVSNEIYSTDSLTFENGIQSERYRFIPNFSSYNYLQISSEIQEHGGSGELIEGRIKIHNPTDQLVNLVPTAQVHLIFFQYEKEKATRILFPSMPFSQLKPGESQSFEVAYKLPETSGAYYARFAIYHNELAGLNSPLYPIEISE